KRGLGLGVAVVAPAGCQQEKVHKGKTARAWIEQLKEGRWADQRWRAAQALGEMAPESRQAIPYLIEALGDKDDFVRWTAAGALARFAAEAEPAVGPLRELAGKDPDRAVRHAAQHALRAIEHEAAKKRTP